MKKSIVIIMLSALTLGSCCTHTADGAMTGGMFGAMIGSAIGGLSGGWRGSNMGQIVGMAGGAAVGAAIGAPTMTSSILSRNCTTKNASLKIPSLIHMTPLKGRCVKG